MCSITIYNSEMLSLIAVLLLTFLVFLSLNSFQAGQILGKTWCSKYLKSPTLFLNILVVMYVRLLQKFLQLFGDYVY